MAAIKDIIVQVIPGAPTVARVGFGVPMLVGFTGSRAVLISGSGTSGIVAKSVTRQADIELEITNGAIFAYVFTPGAPGNVAIEVPVGTLVRELIADFNANAPTSVTDEISLEALTTGSGVLGLISPAELLTFTSFLEIQDISQIQFFYDTTDEEYEILSNMFGSKPSPIKIFLLDVFGSVDVPGDIETVNDGSWYAIITTSITESEQQEISDYVDDKIRLFLMTNLDEAVLDNIQSRRTAVIIHNAPGDHPEASWAAKNLPSDPGSITWKWTSALQGQAPNIVATLTALINVRNKKAQSYVTKNSVNYVDEGQTTDPNAQTFIDQVRSQDWIQLNLEADLLQLFINASAAGSKIPYTDSGISQVIEVISKRLALAGAAGIIAPVETQLQAELSYDGLFRYQIKIPTRAEIEANTPANITNRILDSVDFSYVEAGAIHGVKPITGRVILTEPT